MVSHFSERFPSLVSDKRRYFTLAHEIAHNLVHPHNSEWVIFLESLEDADDATDMNFISLPFVKSRDLY
jgi:hypothetical protein